MSGWSTPCPLNNRRRDENEEPWHEQKMKWDGSILLTGETKVEEGSNMPRTGRRAPRGHVVHTLTRGNNRQDVFRAEKEGSEVKNRTVPFYFIDKQND